MPGLDAVLSSVDVTVVDGARRLAGAGVEAAVARWTGWLASAGVAAGDFVSWQLPNGIEAYLLYRSCWRLGAIAAPVHHAAGRADLAAVLAQITPAVIVTSAGLPAAEVPGNVLVESIAPDTALDAALDAASLGAVEPASLAVVLFTSGSTGVPKGVRHTHRGLVSKAKTMALVHGLGPDDCVLMPAPLAHISGLLNGVLVPGVAGMKTVLMRKWDPAAALDLIVSEAVTFMIGPPTFFVSLMDAPSFSTERVSSLRLVSSGGAGVTPAFVSSASSRLACYVKRTYGSTEAPTITTSGPLDPPERARDSDGRAVGEAAVTIHDPVSLAVLPAGRVGEVWLRGPEICEGYLDEAATRSAFTDDGWFRTGDLGQMDVDGWLTITGRIKDVIIRGGENISAAELEAVLEHHPDIRQAAVVGYPDDRLGQRVCAVVVAAGVFGLVECQAWMQSQGVTRFKWPERVVQLDALPLLAAGKIDRAALSTLATTPPSEAASTPTGRGT